MNNDILLHLRNIAYAYAGQKQHVLQHIDFHLMRGELVALVAPSGSGKSTLLNIIGLLEQANSGLYMINNSEAPTPSSRHAARIRNQQFGFIFQFHHLMNECNICDNIAMPLLIQGKGKKYASAQAMQALQQLHLDHYAKRTPKELSGGEQQRIAILRALIHQPQLIIADEPTGNLDPENADIIFDMFVHYAKSQHSAALIATHNHQLAQKCDRIITIDKGKVVAFDHGVS